MKKFSGFVFGALLGGVISSITVLLLTPSSGDDLRADLQQKVKDIQAEIKTAAAEKRVELEEELQRLRAPVADEETADISIE
ncbi:MAG: hypothetical protein DRI56_13495 [Chloroflexota bacterium]|nr:MAG: hypothetical protein DRI56_13495 [Chloroflexota bacterium]